MKVVFSDFDGTLTTPQGALDTAFYSLLKLIQENTSSLVVVSGRSISWGHFLLTHFPLKHVIMEGGGVIITKQKDGSFKEENLVYDEDIKDLESVTEKIKKNIPDCVLSADSFGRRTDRAIEFSQMSKESCQEVEKFLRDNNVNFSRSNVHINYWVGDVSKSNAVKYFIENYMPHIDINDCIYYGDSLNDESMFEYFPNTVGVSNILSVLDKLKHKPKIILEGKDNAGISGVLSHLKEVFDQSVDF